MPIHTERFKEVPLFEGLSPEEARRLNDLGIERTAQVGDVIVQEDASGDSFFVVESGAFEVRKMGTQCDGEAVLARLEELACFGEMSLISRTPRTASVVCVEDGMVTEFSAADFDALLEQGDTLAYKLVHNMSKILVRRLARMDQEVASWLIVDLDEGDITD